MANRAHRVTATGTAYDAGAAVECAMRGARLLGGSDISKAIIRETDGSGAVLCELQCAANESDESMIPILFRQKLHVTLTGTGAACTVYV